MTDSFPWVSHLTLAEVDELERLKPLFVGQTMRGVSVRERQRFRDLLRRHINPSRDRPEKVA